MPLVHPLSEPLELLENLLSFLFAHLLQSFFENDRRCFEFSLVLFKEESPVDVELWILESDVVVVHVLKDHIGVARLVGVLNPNSLERRAQLGVIVAGLTKNQKAEKLKGGLT